MKDQFGRVGVCVLFVLLLHCFVFEAGWQRGWKSTQPSHRRQLENYSSVSITMRTLFLLLW